MTLIIDSFVYCPFLYTRMEEYEIWNTTLFTALSMTRKVSGTQWVLSVNLLLFQGARNTHMPSQDLLQAYRAEPGLLGKSISLCCPVPFSP